jgi:hypothetical protein
MKTKVLLHLTWFIPAALAALLIQQVFVWQGVTKTFEEGSTHTAYITDFRIKQIAAQTNGYVVLQFLDATGEEVRQRLSLHAQHASRLIGKNEVEIRYLPGTTYDIVMVETYPYHRNTILINLAVIGLSLLVMIPVAIFASRYASGKVKGKRNDNLELEFEKA